MQCGNLLFPRLALCVSCDIRPSRATHTHTPIPNLTTIKKKEKQKKRRKKKNQLTQSKNNPVDTPVHVNPLSPLPTTSSK